MIAQIWADLVTVSSFIAHTPVILLGGLGLVASAITAAIVSEVKNK